MALVGVGGVMAHGAARVLAGEHPVANTHPIPFGWLEWEFAGPASWGQLGLDAAACAGLGPAGFWATWSR